MAPRIAKARSKSTRGKVSTVANPELVKRHFENRFKSDSLNSFWRFGGVAKPTIGDLRYQLLTVGHSPKSKLLREDLEEQIRVHVHGQLAYRKSSKADLMKFISDRGLVVAEASGTVNAPSKKQFAETLVKADKDRKFTRLFDLPPELRLCIFDFHFADFVRQRGLKSPSQPPLTLTCRTIRHCALPLFFQQCKFSIDLSVSPSDADWPEDAIVPGPLHLNPSSETFLCHIPHRHLRHLRALSVCYIDRHVRDRAAKYDAVYHTTRVDIKLDRTSPLLAALRGHSRDCDRVVKGELTATMQEMNVELRKLVQKAGEEWYQKATDATVRY
ncbi:uncharacterized protein LTR77_004525 [Saxophila tyrrhenica]|uniref:Uncharacterized protein n=1 Tax=Saxophila tyrrhenica TaxID=1690608 RepID=A0AAV9PDU5_9PEZI|nr:hypothetical protein LTR77_004525 [Saxophila tyrrhenica]